MGEVSRAPVLVAATLALLAGCSLLPNKEKKCAAGDYRACSDACAQGKLESCARQAGMQWDGRGTPRNPKAAAVLATSACDKKCLAGCAMLGKFHLHGDGVPFSRERALALIRQACDGGDPLGCALKSKEDLAALDVPEASFHAALQAGTRACAAGWEDGCLLVAHVHERSQKLKDHAKSREMKNDWCQRGSLHACLEVGFSHEFGSGGYEKNPTQALLMYQKACQGGVPYACVKHGEFAEKGGGAAGRRAAYLLYKKGCRLAEQAPENIACKKEKELQSRLE